MLNTKITAIKENLIAGEKFHLLYSPALFTVLFKMRKTIEMFLFCKTATIVAATKSINDMDIINNA